jgi:spore maturation protein CgeB
VDVERLLFVGSQGDTAYHRDRKPLLRELGAQVFNGFHREERIVLEEQSPELYRRARYCLAVSPPAPGYNSLRLYNILAAGGFALVRYFPGLEDLFEEGRHLAGFEASEEALEVMDDYDADPEEYERIRWAGWRRAQALHTVPFRIANMAAIMTGAAEDFWGHL